MEAKPAAYFPGSLFSKGMGTHVGFANQGHQVVHKEGGEGGEPMLAVGVATPRFPRLWCSDANNGTVKRQGLSTSADSPVGHGQ